ncbi:MAG: cobyrinate a,c-diamide synthase [Victivallales bacterium]|jgi:cobyrinic acid a,c-diamide synthase|nr:cobyrinate a,c-diamide synthase [Victivallales bacterium]
MKTTTKIKGISKNWLVIKNRQIRNLRMRFCKYLANIKLTRYEQGCAYKCERRFLAKFPVFRGSLKPSAFMIAGTNSGGGKTTLTLGILRALIQRGVTVSPFKCGPDYIDPLFHQAAAKCSSINCDTFLMGKAGVKTSCIRNSSKSQVSVFEGVMGLFDGNAPGEISGSSAEIAALLKLPVILVVNARGLSGSIAPLVRGFARWNSHVRIVGVIANFVGSTRHADLLRDSLKLANLPPLLGVLFRDEKWKLPERHLGLSTELPTEEWLESLGREVENSIDIDRILELTCLESPLEYNGISLPNPTTRLGVAYDEAFGFYYSENFDLLRQSGVEICFFSPLHDAELPPDLDGLYFGGGFPELYAGQLSQNSSMLKAIRDFADSGRIVYGECGGYLFLLKSLTDLDGKNHPMLGLLPGEARMGKKLACLGYRELETCAESIFGATGTKLRGHEFHYSSLSGKPPQNPLFYAQNLRGEQFPAGSICNNVYGSYVHLHFASNPAAVKAFAKRLKR